MSTWRGHRSVADQLRSWPDRRLADLLTARPDLATPAPHDFGQLASRVTVRASITRALDILTRPELSVLDALVVLGQTRPDEVRRSVRAAPATVDAALQRLADLVLVWESTDGLQPLSGVADGLLAAGGAGVSGLWARRPDPPDAARIEALVAQLSPDAAALLDRLLAAPRVEVAPGSDRPGVDPDHARTPGEELLARRLLVPRGEVLLVPGEVGLARRGGTTTLTPVDDEPPLATAERDPATVEAVAAGAAAEAVRQVETMLERWSTHPASALRGGGLGVRELRSVATLLGLDDSAAALLVEVASAAGLIAGRADADGRPVWVPSDAYDDWSAADTAARWRVLAVAWLDTDRVPGLVGSRDAAGAVRTQLSTDLVRPWASETRRAALEVLAELPPGTTLAAGTGVASVVARAEHRRPRRPRGRADQVAWALTEAAALGVTGLGGATVWTRSLLAGRGDDAARALAAALPTPVDHVLVQADLTAVAPGPLEPELARRMALLADVESQGAATTYRFTSGSVRRALDVGWTSAEVHAFLEDVSRTPVPQPLHYLVDDTARTFGSVRVGPAAAVVRSDDEAALAALVHHPRAAAWGLRLLAPTVAVSATPVDVLLPRLRELGAAPVVEGPDGVVRVDRPEPWRARVPRGARTAGVAARTAAQAAAAVRSVRSGDADRARGVPAVDDDAEPAAAGPLPPSGSMAALREAAELGRTVAIGYADDQGGVSERLVDPVAVEGGHLTARPHRADGDVGPPRTFAVHRITTVRSVERPAP